jgi:hypothetical protein
MARQKIGYARQMVGLPPIHERKRTGRVLTFSERSVISHRDREVRIEKMLDAARPRAQLARLS